MSGQSRIGLHPGAYPALRISILFATGIVAGRYSAKILDTFGTHLQTTVIYPAGFLLLLIITGLAAILGHSGFRLTDISYRKSLLIGAPVLYLLSIFFAGWFHSLVSHHEPQKDEHILSVFTAPNTRFFGKIQSVRETRTGNTMAVVLIDSVRIDSLPLWGKSFRTEVLFPARPDTHSTGRSPQALSTITPDLLPPGTSVSFNGKLDIPDPPRNPYQFDYRAFLARRNIYSRITASHIETQPSSTTSFWVQRQATFTRSLSRLFSEERAGLALAILAGDRSRLDPELRIAFSRAGLAHLMAVSGMHVGFVLLPLWPVLSLFRGSVSARIAGLFFSGTVLLFYAGVTGFSVSVSRASLMAFFLILARLFHKPGNSMNILGAAALILLILDPLLLFDIGFQLSFLAVIIILTTLPSTRFLLPAPLRFGKTAALMQFIMVSTLVQAGLYPLLVYYFQEFSLAGPLSNMLAVPLVQLIFLLAFSSLGLSLIKQEIGVFLNMTGDYLLSWLVFLVERIGTHPYSWIESTLGSLWLFGIWFFAMATLASLRLPLLRWKMVIGLLACMLGHQSGELLRQVRCPQLYLTFFDVGQGDAVLLQTPGGQAYLYDTGVWSPNYDSAMRTLIPELKARGIRHLNGVILSHPHSDHIGGMTSLLQHIPIDTIYQSPATTESAVFHHYMELAMQRQIPVRTLSSGESIERDASLLMMVLAPSDEIPARDLNNQSVVMLVQYGQSRVLLTGDAEHEAELFLVQRFGDFLQSDLLKVGHHASRTSSTNTFLKHVNPAEAVASLGLRNRYEHPHPEVVRRLAKAGIHTRYTSLQGAIIYSSKGDRFRYRPWNHPPLPAGFPPSDGWP